MGYQTINIHIYIYILFCCMIYHSVVSIKINNLMLQDFYLRNGAYTKVLSPQKGVVLYAIYHNIVFYFYDQ